jgi:hypothetical protein
MPTAQHSTAHEGAQDHTYPGLRGNTVIAGLTFHQLHDAVLVGYNRARMMPDDADPFQVGDNDDIDPVALAQNVCNRMEELQGIFPNTIVHGSNVSHELRDPEGSC